MGKFEEIKIIIYSKINVDGPQIFYDDYDFLCFAL
jgi:hypothetical protein